MIVWWAAAPFLFWGFWFSFRHRLRPSLAICLFTTGLTSAYALYLTNFGTAHRMRVQILGFFIIFVCIGWHQYQLKRQRKRSSSPMLSRIPVQACSGGSWSETNSSCAGSLESLTSKAVRAGARAIAKT